MRLRFIFIMVVLTWKSPGFSEDSCPVPKDLNDILLCLKQKHQLVLIKDQELKVTAGLADQMGQSLNPSLDIQTVHNSDSRQTQVILAQPLDLGGKLSALKAKGSLLHRLKQNELSTTKEEVIEVVLLNIHHLIHLKETLSVNLEVFSSLGNVMRALKRRPVLSSEQEASLLNFRLQQAEVRNILSLLEDEEEEILLFFNLNGGYEKHHVLKAMQAHNHQLELIPSSDNLSLNLQRLGLQREVSHKEFQLQKALLWDGITIGPMFMDDKLGGVSEKLYGVALTLPIPLWHTNQTGKALASSTLNMSSAKYSLQQRKEELEKGSLLQRIDKLKLSLSDLPPSSELLKTHQRIERLFSKGLITPASFLDSHRIWRDVISSKLELEEKILKLSIDYYRLIGKLNEVHL